MDEPAITPGKAIEVFDSHFIQNIENGATGVAVASTIWTSRLIVLTQASSSPLGKAVSVAATSNLTLYGDVVRVEGTITAPGRTIKIFCRRLEFHSRNGTSGIDVTGEKGVDGKPAQALATDKAADGTDMDRPGKTGLAGKDGDGGTEGAKGGDIQIYCGILVRLAPVALIARGGLGGDSADGHVGGAGGNGFTKFSGNEGASSILPYANCLPASGRDTFSPCEFSAKSYGGDGGCGGNGGNGGKGGQGGSIKLYFLQLVDDPGGQCKVTFSVIGGKGGNGGNGGKGGQGGDGGSPDEYKWHLSTIALHYLDGADSGGGGICGLPGYGGLAGNSGEISLAKRGDWCAPLDVTKLPEPPIPLPMMKKPLPSDGDLLEVDARTRSIAEANEEAQLRAYRAALIANNAASTKWVNERDAILKSFPHLPDSQKPGSDGVCPNPQDPDECAKAGNPGKPAKVDQIRENVTANWNYRPGKEGNRHSPNKKRNAQVARQASGPGHPTAQQFPAVGYKDLAVQADFEQLEMLLDHIRIRYLLANVHNPAYDRGPLQEVLDWLFSLADCKAGNSLLAPSTLSAPSPVPEAADDVWAQLRATVFASINNLRLRLNIFGQDAEFTALGSLESYKTDLLNMLALYSTVETVYQKLNANLIAAEERNSYLANVSERQASLSDALDVAQTAAIKKLKDTLAEIEKRNASKDEAATAFTTAVTMLESSIKKAIGITPADVFSALSQLSFTNREFHGPQAAAAAGAAFAPGALIATGAMIASQFGDLVTKAVDNVVTDTGVSINKNLVIRRMEFLSKDVGTIAGLKETGDGLLQADPNAECRLMATREQVESICSNFYVKYPEAKEVSGYLDVYIEAVAARNQKVEEYNQNISELAYVAAELLRTKAQKQLADTWRQKAASPGLPALAKFARALRRHAWEDCVQQLYIASRVLSLKSLDFYDVFADVLGQLSFSADAAELKSEALNTGLISFISTEMTNRLSYKTTLDSFEPKGAHCCMILTRDASALPSAASLVVDNETQAQFPTGPTPVVRPDLFNLLRQGKPARFRITAAHHKTDIEQSPFADKSDVRLTHLRCTPTGMKTSDNVYSLVLRHPGFETFVDENDREVHLHHNPVTLSLNGEFSAEVAVDQDHALIGPFCEWEIEISKQGNKGLDLSQLSSIKLEFKGTHRGFA